MGEIEKKPFAESWAEKQKAADEKAKEILGEHTPEAELKEAEETERLVAECEDLRDWYTEAYDKAVLDFGDKYATDTALASAARTLVRTTWGEKFDRLRELEKQDAIRNAKQQGLQNAAHASVIEANLRQTLLMLF